MAPDPAGASPPHQTEELAAEVMTPPPLTEHTALLGLADPALYDELSQILRDDGVRTMHATGGAAASSLARTKAPSLIILERNLPGDGLEACRAIRQAESGALAEVPIIVIAAQEEVGTGIAAGVTDWLVKPFSDIYARTRMRAWLMRMTCRWTQPPFPANEAQRLAALHDLGILDTQPEERFDRLTRVAAATFDVPIALVSLVDEKRQWFKSACGGVSGDTPRELSFCAHAILNDAVMVVPDALLDERFADHPAVVGGPRVRFYAGCPLILDDGACVGTLCLIDTRPRHLDGAAIHLLQDLASLVLQELKRPRGPYS
jgi:DNA-binding response OmpR family regulator